MDMHYQPVYGIGRIVVLKGSASGNSHRKQGIKRH